MNTETSMESFAQGSVPKTVLRNALPAMAAQLNCSWQFYCSVNLRKRILNNCYKLNDIGFLSPSDTSIPLTPT